jgi:hypothetical protein
MIFIKFVPVTRTQRDKEIKYYDNVYMSIYKHIMRVWFGPSHLTSVPIMHS